MKRRTKLRRDISVFCRFMALSGSSMLPSTSMVCPCLHITRLWPYR